MQGTAVIVSYLRQDRLSFIGKEQDNESGLGDFGVRKYDDDIGRFTSIDPMWEKYYAMTPYHYSANNPVSFLDPNGFRVQGKSSEAQELIKGSVESENQDKVLFDKDGYVVVDYAAAISGMIAYALGEQPSNYQALMIMAFNSERTVELTASDNGYYMFCTYDEKGNVKGGDQSFITGKFAYGANDEQTSTGIFFPGYDKNHPTEDSDGRYSVIHKFGYNSGNAIVAKVTLKSPNGDQVSVSPQRLRTTAAEELLGHGFFWTWGLPCAHEEKESGKVNTWIKNAKKNAKK